MRTDMRTRWLLLALLLAEGLGQAWCESVGCTAANGKDGFPGKTGRDGRPGQKGDQGDPGPSSRIPALNPSKGDTGERGTPGEPGLIGYKGPEGPPGTPGDQGPKGSKGAMADTKEGSKPVFSATRPAFKGNVLVFGQVITSEGSIYNSDSGKVTCAADPGYYYFTFQAVSEGDLCLQIYVKRSGQKEQSLLTFCDRNWRKQQQVNSGGAVLRLSPGDQVWIQADGSKSLSSSDDRGVFSGFLLFPQIN